MFPSCFSVGFFCGVVVVGLFLVAAFCCWRGRCVGRGGRGEGGRLVVAFLLCVCVWWGGGSFFSFLGVSVLFLVCVCVRAMGGGGVSLFYLLGVSVFFFFC